MKLVTDGVEVDTPAPYILFVKTDQYYRLGDPDAINLGGLEGIDYD